MQTKESKICRLIYYSTPTANLAKQDLDAILAESRENNTKRGITGLLAYDSSFFMQVLEGPEAEVTELFLRIGADTRHHSLRLVDVSQIEEARFDDWVMAIAELPELPGKFLNQLYGGFNPPRFSAQIAVEYFEILRDYLRRTH